MKLVSAVKRKGVKVIEQLYAKKGIPVDEAWSDYEALNIAIVQRKRTVTMFLLENDCRVNKIPVTGEKPSNTPLHNAVKQRDFEIIDKLLNKNASVTAVNHEGNSPLHLAFILGCEKIIDSILDCIEQTAALANLKNRHGLTHFHIACTRSNANLVLSYINSTTAASFNDSINKNSLSYYAGYTVLQFAMQSKLPLILKLVLEHSRTLYRNKVASSLEWAQQDLECAAVKVYLLSSYARYNVNFHMSQFHIACMQRNPNFVKTFIGCGAPVNKPINEGAASCPLYTPLHLAVEANCKESIQLLLEHGADPDLQNIKFMTPLHLSLYNGNKEILDLLYAQAKNKDQRANLTDCYGLQYFHIAVSMNDFQFVFKFLGEDQNTNARVLPNSPNCSGYTPLHFAVRYGNLEMAKLLIKNGADVNACDATQDGTPLHIAFYTGHTQIILLLLNHQSRINRLRPCDKKTILHLLVEKIIDMGEKNNSQLILYVKQLVFDCGIDVNAQDSDGYTALHYACMKIAVGASCAQILIECGADINIANARGITPFEISFDDDYCDNPSDYMLLYNHIQKLKALDLVVNEKNYDCCTKLLKDRKKFLKAMSLRNSTLARKQERRTAELNRMKIMKLWPDTSVYDFVLKNSLGLRALRSNAPLKNNMKIKCFKKTFPLFGYFVDLQWRKLKSLYSNNEYYE